MGLNRAGFEVEGWDINPQPYYPFKFHHENALDADLTGFDFVWASPPCQRYTIMQNLHKNGNAHPDLIEPVRTKLKGSGLVWAIENVRGAPLFSPIMLCGTMFGLNIIKHRYFETSFRAIQPLCACDHRGTYSHFTGKNRTKQKMQAAQGTPWIPDSGGASRKKNITGDLNNAIPPAYSEFIGHQAIEIIRHLAP